jgi:hypothetical protein
MVEHYEIRPGIIPICDFCSSPGPKYIYPAITCTLEQVGPLTLASVEGWAACSECSALIDAKDKEGLRHRAVATYIEKTFSFSIPEQVRQELEDIIKTVHGSFWLCKHGDKKEATQDDTL